MCFFNIFQPISQDQTVKLIYAYGSISRDGPTYHGPEQRGVKNVYMKAQKRFMEYPDENNLGNLKYVDFKMNNVSIKNFLFHVHAIKFKVFHFSSKFPE